MKKLISIILLSFITITGFASSKVLNVYNWGGYIPNDVIEKFSQQTGIKVNYSTYDSDEIAYTKIKADPNGAYDVIFPSADYVQRMIKEGMLAKLDHRQLPNLKNLNPLLLNRPFDPGNQYSVPFAWGTNGIVVDDQYYQLSSVTQLQDLWQKRFRGQLLMFDDVRDVFAIAFRVLGYSVNDTNPQHIKQAYLKLKALAPNIKLYDADSTQQVYCDGNATIGVAENGDAAQAHKCNAHYQYVYPKNGVIAWVDSMVILKRAPHLQNAYKFINFILQPKIALEINRFNGYSTANNAAFKLMTKAEQGNQIINPTPADLKGMQFEAYIGDQARNLYLQYWQQLKLEG